MAINTYLPDYVSVSGSGSTTFDGSTSSTNEALITEGSADFDANIFVERSNDNGSTWQQVAQIDSLTGDWRFQGERIIVSQGNRRLKVTDTSGGGGVVEVSGDEI